jgi:hypothetical protein
MQVQTNFQSRDGTEPQQQIWAPADRIVERRLIAALALMVEHFLQQDGVDKTRHKESTKLAAPKHRRIKASKEYSK